MTMSEVSFVEEIRDMLWGLGDAGRGQLKTAQIIESIIIQQLQWLWIAICELAADESALLHRPTIEHFLFLFRKEPNRIKRIFRYLRRKNLAHSMTNIFNADPLTSKSAEYRRCLEYMTNIDPFFEVQEHYVDEMDKRRISRSDLASRVDDEAVYRDFVRARKTSFGHGKNTAKFAEFMTMIDFQNARTAETVDLMAFLSFEMMIELVDMVFMIRHDRQIRTISVNEVREVYRRLQSCMSKPGALLNRLPPEWGGPPLVCF